MARGGSAADELRERDGVGDVELLVAAALRRAVGAPADERHAVAEAALLELAERDLGDPFDADRHPREVLAGVPTAPPARPAGPVAGLAPRPTPPRGGLARAS